MAWPQPGGRLCGRRGDHLSEPFAKLLKRRRMCRSYRSEAVAPELVDAVLDQARRAPSAGNCQPLRFVVLTGESLERYWDLTLPTSRRASFPWPGLLRAPVLALAFVDPDAYASRYSEADKLARPTATAEAKRALAGGVEGWQVPYWYVDGGMAVMSLLLGCTDVGLGSLFFGVFEHEAAVRAAFAVPEPLALLGAIALGWPDGADRPALSSQRPRVALDQVVRYGGWSAG